MNIAGAVRGIELHGDEAVSAYADMTSRMLDEVESGMGEIDAALTSGIDDIDTSVSTTATVREIDESIPSFDDTRGRARDSGGGDTTVNNVFHIDPARRARRGRREEGRQRAGQDAAQQNARERSCHRVSLGFTFNNIHSRDMGVVFRSSDRTLLRRSA